MAAWKENMQITATVIVVCLWRATNRVTVKFTPFWLNTIRTR
jgi:hypothetical protein